MNQNSENAIEFPCSFNKRNYLTISERIDELKKSISKCMRKVLILFVPHDLLSIRKGHFKISALSIETQENIDNLYYFVSLQMSLKQD